MYLVEWPNIAYQMSEHAPTIADSTSAMLRFLDDDGHAKACMVAHSLGTTAVSWMLHHPEGCRRVASTVLLDPVIFLLCDPTVATTFVYKVLADSYSLPTHVVAEIPNFASNHWLLSLLPLLSSSTAGPHDDGGSLHALFPLPRAIHQLGSLPPLRMEHQHSLCRRLEPRPVPHCQHQHQYQYQH